MHCIHLMYVLVELDLERRWEMLGRGLSSQGEIDSSIASIAFSSHSAIVSSVSRRCFKFSSGTNMLSDHVKFFDSVNGHCL